MGTCFGYKRSSSGQLRRILRYSNIVLNWPEVGRLRPKYLTKFNLIVIIASYLDICCVLTVHNILYKFDNTQRDGLSQVTLHTAVS